MFATKRRTSHPAPQAPESAPATRAPARHSQPHGLPAWAQRYEQQAETLTPPATHAAAPSRRAAAGGRPLDRRTRNHMQARFGTSFDDVRVHTGPQAAASAREAGARAYTSGADIVFADGQHAPDSSAGQRLIAHELVHVMQQRAGVVPYGMVQRAGNDAKDKGPITVQDIFPFEKGDHVELKNVMEYLTKLAVKKADESGEAAPMLEALQRLTGKVEAASPDLLTLAFDSAISLPAVGESPARSLTNVKLKLERAKDGTFGITISGKEGSKQKVLMSKSGLKATRDPDGTIRFDVPPGLGVDDASVAFKSGKSGTTISAELSVLSAKLFQVKKLKSAPKVSAKSQEEDVEKVLEPSAGAKRQDFTLGAGFQFSQQATFSLSAAWRYNFATTGILESFGLDPLPSAVVGEVVEIPLEVQVLYAPTEHAVLGAVNTGFNLALPASLTRIPINVRLLSLGLGGGTLAAKESPGVNAPAFGLTAGSGVGIAVTDWLLLEVRYDYLKNFLPKGPNAHMLQGGIGAQF